MTATQQTKKQIERAIRKVIDKFPSNAEAVLTDIHLQVKPESGELLAYNDDMEELTRIVVDQWLEPTEDNLYEAAENTIKAIIKSLRVEVEKMSILHPFSFVMMGEDGETMADIYIVDDDTIMIDTQLLKDFDKDLDAFLEQLMKE
jgi:gas vesicle protein